MKIEFEYDENKSRSNKQKHSIDFEESKELFGDDLVVVCVNTDKGESRYLAVGKLYDKFYTVVYTYRGLKVRIISVRRSRKNEERLYEEYRSKRV